MTETKAKLTTPIIVLLVLAALGAGYFTFSNPGPKPLEAAETEVEQATEEADQNITIDVKKALSVRIVGDPNAPIRISEHSSLTCGHCGKFHKETYKMFKENYLDTGKAYLVFSDFPLNAPALHASMVARCLPHDKYFDFVQMLFETQEDWAYSADYMDKLKAKAAENGLDETHFKACVTNKELLEGVANAREASQKQWGISSTPSFVVNNKITVGGALPYPEFSKMINEAVEKSKAEASESE